MSPEATRTEDPGRSVKSVPKAANGINGLDEVLNGGIPEGAPQPAFDYCLRLIDHYNQRGITTLLTHLTSAPGGREGLTCIDLSSVIDKVIILRDLESEEGFRREMAILKSRGRDHSSLIHPFRITSRGVELAGKEPSDVE